MLPVQTWNSHSSQNKFVLTLSATSVHSVLMALERLLDRQISSSLYFSLNPPPPQIHTCNYKEIFQKLLLQPVAYRMRCRCVQLPPCYKYNGT
jgi:hypothetical protein